MSIRIDAVVTDRQGRAIVDLRPGELELMENGAARPIGAVELRSAAHGDPASPASPILSEDDEQRAAREPGTRVFGIVLDEFHIAPGAATKRARDVALKLIDDLAPGDMAVVLKPMDSVTAIRFSRDRTALRAAVAGFAGRKGDYAPRTPFEEDYIGRAPVAVQAARAQIVTAALRELTMRLGELRADRGIVVLVSEGFPRDNPGARQLRMPDLQGIVRASSRFHLVMYTLNPGDREESVPGSERERSTSTLDWLATQTGGRYQAIASATGDSLRPALVRLSADLASYYALTYQPAKADGRFHTLAVRSTRRDVEVRARAGYWAPVAGELNLLRGSGATRLAASRRTLRRSTVIEAWVGLGHREGDGRARMAVTWNPPARPAVARSAAVRWPHAVVVKARTDGGIVLFDGRIASVGTSGEPDVARFDVPAGRVELDMAILAADGQLLDTDIRNVDVPDFRAGKPGPVVLSPEIIIARSAREFQAALDSPQPTPSPVRTFARGDRLVIRVPAFDSSATAVAVTLRVLNRMAQPMRTIAPTTGTTIAGITTFALPLSWLAPGEYEMDVIAANAQGSARQRVAFKVR